MTAEINKPRVLVMSLIFPPDGVSTAQLLGEIVEDLIGNGNDVQVITTNPHYNYDAVANAQQEITWNWHRLMGTSTFCGVEVHHIRMPGKAAGKLGRIGQWLWFHVASLVWSLSRRGTYDVIFTASPPPSVALVAALLKRLTGAPFVYAVWELYPEILIKLERIKPNGVLHRALKVLERLTYRTSDRVAVLHDAMRDSVVASFPEAAEKTVVVPTFADTDFLRPLDSNTDLRTESGLGESFVVGYAGNLGAAQDLRPIIAAVDVLRDEKVSLLISGDGSFREILEKDVQDRGLSNVTFTGHLPYERVPEVIASCDLSLVVLADGVGAEALPSKLYRIMSCGKPVLAVTQGGSPLHRLVRDHQIGLVVAPDVPDEMAKTILWASRNPIELDDMGHRGRLVAETEFDRKVVTGKYGQLLRDIASQ